MSDGIPLNKIETWFVEKYQVDIERFTDTVEHTGENVCMFIAAYLADRTRPTTLAVDLSAPSNPSVSSETPNH